MSFEITGNLTGPVGPSGAQGSQGATGIQGASGNTGPTGSTGPTGPTGSNGATGNTGSAGSNGTNGAAGATGTANASASTPSRTFGGTAFQPNTSGVAVVSYGVTIGCTANLVGGQEGKAELLADSTSPPTGALPLTGLNGNIRIKE